MHSPRRRRGLTRHTHRTGAFYPQEDPWKIPNIQGDPISVTLTLRYESMFREHDSRVYKSFPNVTKQNKLRGVSLRANDTK
jgi:hypothetical protein